MLKLAAPLAFSVMLTVAACSSSNYNKDEVPDLTPDALYTVAQRSMASGNFGKARQYLEAIDARYPFGELSEQVQLDLIYVYYKSRDSELTSAQINRYLRLSPTSNHADYVIYMKGLNQMQMRGDVIQDFLGLDRAQKDPTQYYAAMKTFRQLLDTYPNSPYAADAQKRMVFIKEQLAKRELKIAQYYYEREAYLSSIRHCQSILYSYKETQVVPEAISLMKDSYAKLGLSATPVEVQQSVKDAPELAPVQKDQRSWWEKITDLFSFLG